MEATAPAAGSFVRFFASGGFNTLVTWLLYLVLLRKLSYQVSFSIAFACGIVLAYLMNRYLVFRQPGGRAGPLWVLLIYGGQYLANLGLVTVWVGWWGLPAALAPLFAVAVTLPFTYLLNRSVFSADPRAEQAQVAAALQRAWQRRGPAATVLLVALPLVSLALNALSWLRFGVDLPYFDDWRGYDSWDVDSLDFIYLFRPLNDTLTPVGLALDALAQRYLDGNSIVYQFISMVAVLGALLLLQWKLLRAALGDSLRVAVCFAFTLLMLQPHSYWGRENLAYQQALPLVFILGALWLAVVRPQRSPWALVTIFGLGLLAGLTYISGAFGALAAGIGVVAASLLQRERAPRVRLLGGGAGLLLAGALTAACQVLFAILPQRGQTHIGGKAMALPFEPDFWFFYLGKLARSLLLPPGWPALSMALLLAFAALVLAGAMVVVKRALAARPLPANEQNFLVVAAAIGALVLTYLGLISAGRAHFRPPEVQAPLEVFQHGFERFHFFWATLLWPWVVAGLMLAVERRRAAGGGPRWIAVAGPAGVVVALVAMLAGGALDHVRAHHDNSFHRHGTIECLAEKLQQSRRIDCVETNMHDATSAYVYARHLGASFVRYFPVQPVPLGRDDPSPWFRLSRDPERIVLVDIERLPNGAYRAGARPQLHIRLASPREAGGCAMLDVRGTIRTATPGSVRIHFRPWGLNEYDNLSYMTNKIRPGADGGAFSFRMEFPLGFGNEVRIDPLVGEGEFELGEIEARCRLHIPTGGAPPFYSIRDSGIPSELQKLEPTAGGPGQFKAGDRPSATFRTHRKYEMATCRVLEVDATYKVQADDTAQLFFRPREAKRFSEEHSVSRTVSAAADMQHVVFLVESPSGFADELRLDPVRKAQMLQVADVTVRCLKRTLRHKNW